MLRVGVIPHDRGTLRYSESTESTLERSDYPTPVGGGKNTVLGSRCPSNGRVSSASVISLSFRVIGFKPYSTAVHQFRVKDIVACHI